jgi:GntR family transcriptional regulator
LAGLPPNTLLPTEQQLARRYGVSRVTVRQALSVLERAGLLSRQRGRGTIVSPPKVVRSLAPVTTMEEDLGRQGVKLETRVLEFERCRPTPADVQALLGPGRPILIGFLTLLRLVDDRVIAYDRSYFPTALAARLDPESLGDRPVLEIVRELAGSPSAFVDWEIEIGPAPREAAARLGITPRLPVVVSTSTLWKDDGNLIIRTERFYRIDRVKFRHSTRYPATPSSDAPLPLVASVTR